MTGRQGDLGKRDPVSATIHSWAPDNCPGHPRCTGRLAYLRAADQLVSCKPVDRELLRLSPYGSNLSSMARHRALEYSVGTSQVG